MGWLAQNQALIFQFMPGFISAAIFYALTAHPKSTEFERVIQALIFTVLLKVLLSPILLVLLWLGKKSLVLGTWTPDVELGWMTVLSAPLGLIFTKYANSDKLYEWARRRKWTIRTSYPSEWYGAFIRHGQRRWIILHMKEGRRLYGWPEEWPDQADKGHFVIAQPEWVLEDSSRIPIHQTHCFLIPSSEVERVEFVSFQDDWTVSEQDGKDAQGPLLELHRRQVDGSKTI